MEPTDNAEGIVDDVNALLKLGVGDAYRLEHIKQAYIQNKTLWVTDENYLQHMKKRYLTKIKSDGKEEGDGEDGESPEGKESIHCWKCGKKSPMGGNFCMACGAALFEVGESSDVRPETEPEKAKRRKIPVSPKILILIAIPIIALTVIGGAYSQGMLDDVFEKRTQKEPASQVSGSANTGSPGSAHSKCGAGTVLDPETNSCVLESELKSSTSGAAHSKCGAGTVLDPETNSCVLESELKSSTSGAAHSKCGAGTVLDPETNSCVLDR